MISKQDFMQWLEDTPDPGMYIRDDYVYDAQSRMKLCTVDEFIERCRTVRGCNFESLYYCHGTLEHVLRCKQCSTIIFTTEDEYGYDPNLQCPNCTDYKTQFTYWTPSDIKLDEKKQNTVELLQKLHQDQIEAEERYKRRHLYDWELWKSGIRIGRHCMVGISVEVDNYFRTKLKGLHVRIDTYYREQDEGPYDSKHEINIPLSWSALKMKIRLHRYWKSLKKEYKNLGIQDDNTLD